MNALANGTSPVITRTRWRIDPRRPSVEFQIRSLYGLQTIKGRFERYDGTLDLSAQPSIELTNQAASLTTNTTGARRPISGRPSHRFLADDRVTRRTPARESDERLGPCRYHATIVSIEELRNSIARRLEDVSEQLEQLRAALDALGPSEPARQRSASGRALRSTGTGQGRAATPTAGAGAMRGNRPTLTAGAIDGSGAVPAISATPPPIASQATTPSAESEDTLPNVTADTATAGEATAPPTGADRALHELRSELTAGLRNGRV